MTTRTRLDLFKRFRNEYVAPKQPRLIQIEPAQYLTISACEAACAPDSIELDAQEQALYIVASALRLVSAMAHQREFIFCKLEWLLDIDQHDPGDQVNQNNVDARPCKVMMRMPEFVTSADLACAKASLLERGWDTDMAEWLRRAQLERISEGLCVQMRHTGPTDAWLQAKTLAELHHFAQAQGFEAAGPPHAVYLSSSRHVPPEHLRTVLRLPVRMAHVNMTYAEALVPA